MFTNKVSLIVCWHTSVYTLTSSICYHIFTSTLLDLPSIIRLCDNSKHSLKRIPRIVTTQAILWNVYPELWQLKHFHERYIQNCDNSSNLMKSISRIVTTGAFSWKVYPELWQLEQFYETYIQNCANSSNFMKRIPRIVTTRAIL